MKRATVLKAFSGLSIAFALPFILTEYFTGSVFYSAIAGFSILFLTAILSGLFNENHKSLDSDRDYRTIAYSHLKGGERK